MTSNDNNNIIEGIGNEVLWSISGIIGIVSIGSYFIYNRLEGIRIFSNSNYRSNPHAAQQIAHLRNQVGDAPSNMVQASRIRRNFEHIDSQCPVCLGELHYPVETNCGHLFCAQCVITYWRHGNWLGTIRCPVCRQTVTVLLPCFRSDADNLEATNDIMYNINDYNRHFSGEPRALLDYLWDLPTLLRHASSEFFSVGGLMYMFRLRIFLCFFAALMYLISPLDMIPEAVFGFLGLLDDLFVIFLLAIYVTVIYRRFLASRWQSQ